MTSTVSTHEREWVKGLLQNSEESFRTIYEAYQRPIFSFAFYLTKSRDLSEEVVQEVFIRLWEKRAQLDPESFLLAFLKKVTQNLVLDIFRKAHADRNLQDKLYNNMIAASESAESTANSGAADRILEKELALVYIKALNQLPPQQRLIFSMRHDQNLSYIQIADALGLSKNTVRNHLSLATNSIRKYVSQNADLSFLLLAIFLDRHM